MHIRRLVGLLKNLIIPVFADQGRVRNDGVFNLRSVNLCVYLPKVIAADVVNFNRGT